MKIVTWNCRGNFSNKYRYIKQLNADVYIIQECDRPEDSREQGYRDFSSNSLWVGHYDKNGAGRGLGIFVKEGHTIKDNRWSQGDPGYYISCRIDNAFDLLGVWAYNDKDGCYAPGVLNYMTEHKDRLNTDYVIAGDFNLDESIKGQWKSSKEQTKKTFALLNSIGLVGAYQKHFGESHGNESRKTFYRGGKPSSHIDYVFAEGSKIKNAELLNPNIWIRRGIDHLPLVIDLEIKS